MAPCHKEGAIAEQAERGANLRKTVFAFFKNSILALWCKAMKIGEQSYTFLILLSKTAFSKSPRMFWEFGCCCNLWQGRAAPVFFGAQR